MGPSPASSLPLNWPGELLHLPDRLATYMFWGKGAVLLYALQ